MAARDWIIREATTDDAAALRRHVVGVAAERLPTLTLRDEPPPFEKITASLRELTAAPNSLQLIAVLGEDVVGGLDFGGHRKPQFAHGGELGMSVAKAFRAQGIGTALLNALFAWAPAHGISRIELRVFANNPDAIRLYERLGFVREGVRRNAVRIDAGFLDVIEMTKQL